MTPPRCPKAPPGDPTRSPNRFPRRFLRALPATMSQGAPRMPHKKPQEPPRSPNDPQAASKLLQETQYRSTDIVFVVVVAFFAPMSS